MTETSLSVAGKLIVSLGPLELSTLNQKFVIKEE